MEFLLSLVIGLFLLLFGMKTLRRGLELYAGNKLQKSLMWMTNTPWKGFWTGTIGTAALQSSTALTVMAVSFVDARLLNFQNALGLILGSNVGTTVTTQLLAFPLENLSIYLMLTGALGYLVVPSRLRYLTLACLGLGTLFFSLGLLRISMEPLAELERVQAFLHEIGDNHLKGVLTGTVLSALLHSSSATTGIVMLLAEDGYLSLPAALAFIFGANIGTCFTAVIASLATSNAAQRVALFHVLLNLFGVIIFYPFLIPLAHGLELLGGSLGRQVANAHTIFNLLSSVIALPLLPLAIKILYKLRP